MTSGIRTVSDIRASVLSMAGSTKDRLDRLDERMEWLEAVVGRLHDLVGSFSDIDAPFMALRSRNEDLIDCSNELGRSLELVVPQIQTLTLDVNLLKDAAFLMRAQGEVQRALRYRNLRLSMEFKMPKPWKISYGIWNNISRRQRSRMESKSLWWACT